MKGWYIAAAGIGLMAWLTHTPQPASSNCTAIDGDTLRCEGNLRLRLNGINAAEAGTPLGAMATENLRRILSQATGPVHWRGLKIDRYGRTVAEAYVTDSGGNKYDLSCAQLLSSNAVYVPHWDERRLTYRTCAPLFNS